MIRLKKSSDIRGNGVGSLKEFGISYDSVALTDEGGINWDSVAEKIKPNTKMIGIQRSKGYATRPSFTIAEIAEMIAFVKEIKQDVVVFVDNCYGEFVEEIEPCHVGADLMAGSLIKNPGGGMVKTGGYIVGKKQWVEACSYRMTSPGIGAEAGASLYSLQEMYQGFFLSTTCGRSGTKRGSIHSGNVGEIRHEFFTKMECETDRLNSVSPV